MWSVHILIPSRHTTWTCALTFNNNIRIYFRLVCSVISHDFCVNCAYVRVRTDCELSTTQKLHCIATLFHWGKHVYFSSVEPVWICVCVITIAEFRKRTISNSRTNIVGWIVVHRCMEKDFHFDGMTQRLRHNCSYRFARIMCWWKWTYSK